jgi:large subunit ribosomal protein L5
MATLMERYRAEVRPELVRRLGLKNVNGAPRLVKVVVNMGIGTARKESVNALAEDLARITGQKPVLRKARTSISNFKVRKGMVVGAMVTLRGRRMYEFIERLICAALPRIRDFRGVSPKSFDRAGNFTLGIREQSIFPEIDPNSVTVTQGMDITIVTSAKAAGEARELLALLGMPFAKN